MNIQEIKNCACQSKMRLLKNNSKELKEQIIDTISGYKSWFENQEEYKNIWLEEFCDMQDMIQKIKELF